MPRIPGTATNLARVAQASSALQEQKSARKQQRDLQAIGLALRGLGTAADAGLGITGAVQRGQAMGQRESQFERELAEEKRQFGELEDLRKAQEEYYRTGRRVTVGDKLEGERAERLDERLEQLRGRMAPERYQQNRQALLRGNYEQVDRDLQQLLSAERTVGGIEIPRGEGQEPASALSPDVLSRLTPQDIAILFGSGAAEAAIPAERTDLAQEIASRLQAAGGEFPTIAELYPELQPQQVPEVPEQPQGGILSGGADRNAILEHLRLQRVAREAQEENARRQAIMRAIHQLYSGAGVQDIQPQDALPLRDEDLRLLQDLAEQEEFQRRLQQAATLGR